MFSGILSSLETWELAPSTIITRKSLGCASETCARKELKVSVFIFSASIQSTQSSIEGADGPVNIGELAFVAVIDDGAHGCRGPAAADSHHATEASFVLKEEFYLTALDDFGLKDGCQLFREFFFQSSWTLGLLLGWRVSGATLRHPWRARSL